MRQSTLLFCSFAVLILAVVNFGQAQADALDSEDNNRAFLKRLLSSDLLMAKRRNARELLGKRSDAEFYGRNLRRAKELFGKRSVQNSETMTQRLLGSPEWNAFNQEYNNGQLFNVKSSNEDQLQYLLKELINRRERRARSNELLG